MTATGSWVRNPLGPLHILPVSKMNVISCAKYYPDSIFFGSFRNGSPYKHDVSFLLSVYFQRIVWFYWSMCSIWLRVVYIYIYSSQCMCRQIFNKKKKKTDLLSNIPKFVLIAIRMYQHWIFSEMRENI